MPIISHRILELNVYRRNKMLRTGENKNNLRRIIIPAEGVLMTSSSGKTGAFMDQMYI